MPSTQRRGRRAWTGRTSSRSRHRYRTATRCWTAGMLWKAPSAAAAAGLATMLCSMATPSQSPSSPRPLATPSLLRTIALALRPCARCICRCCGTKRSISSPSGKTALRPRLARTTQRTGSRSERTRPRIATASGSAALARPTAPAPLRRRTCRVQSRTALPTARRQSSTTAGRATPRSACASSWGSAHPGTAACPP